jgi:hypothetical protein
MTACFRLDYRAGSFSTVKNNRAGIVKSQVLMNTSGMNFFACFVTGLEDLYFSTKFFRFNESNKTKF